MNKVTAVANTNIALVKYWGKRDIPLNLPAVGSISLTLEGLLTETHVEFKTELSHDVFVMNGETVHGKPLIRLISFLDKVRAIANQKNYAHISTHNNFPTASGLASSASGFAALALAATRAAGLELSGRDLSILARQGSGSACRSIFGGFVEWHRGERADGLDSYAEPIGGDDWDVRLVVGVTSEGKKAVLSTDGMEHTRTTSPYYQTWVAESPRDLKEAKQAISARNIEKLGVVTERSCLRMHASALGADPGVAYFRGATIEGYHRIVALRKEGVPAWFTCDAGPHIKALTAAENAEKVAAALAEVPGVLRTQICAPGRAARVITGREERA